VLHDYSVRRAHLLHFQSVSHIHPLSTHSRPTHSKCLDTFRITVYSTCVCTHWDRHQGGGVHKFAEIFNYNLPLRLEDRWPLDSWASSGGWVGVWLGPRTSEHKTTHHLDALPQFSGNETEVRYPFISLYDLFSSLTKINCTVALY